MTERIECQPLPKRVYQKCPLCGEIQQIMILGLTKDLETYDIRVAYDRGYSFCNCRNIFYTKWENMDRTIYDERYFAKYDTPNLKTIAENEIERLMPIFKDNNKYMTSFLEIGCIKDYVLDYVSNQKIYTVGLDICNHESSHTFIAADFEEYETSEKYDVIYASHIFEHFKSPGNALCKCYNMLSNSGLLYVAMPDTFFINWSNNKALTWDWHVQEHHILWNMLDFIDYAESFGFKCIHKERGMDFHKQKDNGWFWKQDFKTVFKKV